MKRFEIPHESGLMMNREEIWMRAHSHIQDSRALSAAASGKRPEWGALGHSRFEPGWQPDCGAGRYSPVSRPGSSDSATSRPSSALRAAARRRRECGAPLQRSARALDLRAARRRSRFRRGGRIRPSRSRGREGPGFAVAIQHQRGLVEQLAGAAVYPEDAPRCRGFRSDHRSRNSLSERASRATRSLPRSRSVERRPRTAR